MPEGLGLIPNPRREVGAWPEGSAGDESPPGRLGGARCLQEAGSREDPAPRPSCACYLCPTAALGSAGARWAPLGAKTDFPAPASQSGSGGNRLPFLLFGSSPPSGCAACPQRKPGCERPDCFLGVRGGFRKQDPRLLRDQRACRPALRSPTEKSSHTCLQPTSTHLASKEMGSLPPHLGGAFAALEREAAAPSSQGFLPGHPSRGPSPSTRACGA